MVTIGRMPDTTHDNVHNIPPGKFPYVAGYVTGTSGIQWTADDWKRFPGSRLIRIAQNYGPAPDIHEFHVIDIEERAYTPAEAAGLVRQRVDAGIQWTCLYGSYGPLGETASLIRAMGDHYWVGHVECGLANWNLDEAEASKLVGTLVHGMSCRYVQWASPESNPNTLVPGTDLTLLQANVDLSVVDTSWEPTDQPPPPPVPVPPPTTAQAGLLVTYNKGLLTANVVSTDGGHTWHH